VKRASDHADRRSAAAATDPTHDSAHECAQEVPEPLLDADHGAAGSGGDRDAKPALRIRRMPFEALAERGDVARRAQRVTNGLRQFFIDARSDLSVDRVLELEAQRSAEETRARQAG